MTIALSDRRSERPHGHDVRRDRRHARRRLRRDRRADGADIAQRRAAGRRGGGDPARRHRPDICGSWRPRPSRSSCSSCSRSRTTRARASTASTPAPWSPHADLDSDVAVAAVRGRERSRRVPLGVRRPAAAQGRDPRLPEPVHVRAGLAVGRRHRARAGACRCRQHRHRPGPGHPRSGDPRRPAAARVEQPHRDRASEGHDRRTRSASTWTPRSRSCGDSPGTTTAASPRSREHWSAERSRSTR